MRYDAKADKNQPEAVRGCGYGEDVMSEEKAAYKVSAASDIEETLAHHIKCLELEEPLREYRFHPVRRWRFDFAWPEYKLAVEVNGAIYQRGRHSRGSGLEKDYDKLNNAQLLGWTVLQFSRAHIISGYAADMISHALTKKDNVV